MPNMKHLLKIHYSNFVAILDGTKRAEFRDIRDHDIQPGDIVVLREYEVGFYTGRAVAVRVTHRQESYGIPTGYAVLSIEVVR